MKLSEKLLEVQKFAMSIRPQFEGFPFLAEALRKAGIQKNIWSLPSCQSIYILSEGSVVQQGTPLLTGTHDVPSFNQEALITALRTDQAGKSSFPEFLQATWNAGIVSYDADFNARKVTYYGAKGESYVEAYPAVEIK